MSHNLFERFEEGKNLILLPRFEPVTIQPARSLVSDKAAPTLGPKADLKQCTPVGKDEKVLRNHGTYRPDYTALHLNIHHREYSHISQPN